MQHLLRYIVFATILASSFAARPVFEFASTVITFPAASLFQLVPLAAKKDLLVFFRPSSLEDFNSRVDIMRRNEAGTYITIANRTMSSVAGIRTNGKWVTVWADFGSTTSVFKVESNLISSFSNINGQRCVVLSDDTMVCLNSGNAFETYVFNASSVWQVVKTGPKVGNIAVYGDNGVLHISDTHLLLSGFGQDKNLYIYERQVDLSWNLVANFSRGEMLDLITNEFNGVDTVAIGSATSASEGSLALGILQLFTKVGTNWVKQQWLAGDLVKPIGSLGQIVRFVDTDTLLVTAPGDGQLANFTSHGSVVMFTRNASGLWEPKFDFRAPSGVFGMGVAVSDVDMIVAGVSISPPHVVNLYSAPVCFNQPMDITCLSGSLNNCTNIDVTSLYTVNNPRCGIVKSKLGGLSVSSNQEVQVEYSFERIGASPTSCKTSFSCPSSSIAPVSTPSKVSEAMINHHGLSLVSVAILLVVFILGQ